MNCYNKHTLILNMRVLLHFGVNNPASLMMFLYNDVYNTKIEYVEK